jgi:hypothetical protein
LCDSICCWSAERRSTEVDFILTRGNEHIAIEARSGTHFTDKWCGGLRAMACLAGLTRRISVCPAGPALKTEDGIEVLSFASLAEILVAGCL